MCPHVLRARELHRSFWSFRPLTGIAMRLLLLCTLLLTGCVNDLRTPMPSGIKSPETASDLDLCRDFNRSRSPAVLRILTDRKVLNPVDLQALDDLNVRIGMSPMG